MEQSERTDPQHIGKYGTKEKKDKDIAICKLLDREIRQECKQGKEDHYNPVCAETEELDKLHNPIILFAHML